MENWVNEILDNLSLDKNTGIRKIDNCIKQIPNKKLYKYYSFDSDYTLTNIENDIIYYQNPVNFNDPFDCNIGLSANQIMKIIIPEYIDTTEMGITEEQKKTLLSLIFYDSEENISNEDKIAKELFSTPEFINLFNAKKSGKNISKDEVVNVLINEPTLFQNIFEILKIDNLFNSADSSEILKRLTDICPEYIDSKEKSILDILSKEDDVLQKFIKLSRIFGYDIHTEQIVSFYKIIDIATEKMQSFIGNEYTISCFAEQPNNILMWSHYANKHTGICVEYDFSKNYRTSNNSIILPVEYTEKRPLCKIDNCFIKEQSKYDFSFTQELKDSIIKNIFIKSSIWAYEKEWRQIAPKKELNNNIGYLPIISRIILGINISKDNKKKIIEIANNKGIPVYETKLKSDKYEIVIE